jgi:hypothetical protein
MLTYASSCLYYAAEPPMGRRRNSETFGLIFRSMEPPGHLLPSFTWEVKLAQIKHVFRRGIFNAAPYESVRRCDSPHPG